MSVTAEKARELREKTGAGILDCKNALVECNGNIAEAVIYLQKKGLADAQKRSGRSTDSGRICIAHNSKRAVILELLCETDFVARNNRFVELGKTLTQTFIDLATDNERNDQAEEQIKHAISVIKENIRLQRYTVIQLEPNQRVNSYIHGEDGSLGTLVIASVEDIGAIDTATLDPLIHDIAMHISAYRPRYLNSDEVPSEYREQQIQIFTEQAQSSGKPPNVVEKIAAGKLRKHFSEICLLDQGFVKEEKKSVRSVVQEKSATLQQDVQIVRFTCYKAGEQE